MSPIKWKSHRLRNAAQSLVLVAAMVALLSYLGWLIAGLVGVSIAGASVIGVWLLSPAVSAHLVMQMHGAHALPFASAPQLSRTLATLAQSAGLSHPPTLYYVPSPAVNAFTVGETPHAAICVSDGLLRVLSPRELTAVLAHEISHVRSVDTRLLTLTNLFARITHALSTLGQILLLLNIPLLLLGAVSVSWLTIAVLVLAPATSGLIHLALSRTREFDADLGAVALTNDPLGLARALEKLSRVERGWFRRVFNATQPAGAQWLRTHPATDERIRRLRALRPNVPMASPGWTSRGDLIS